MKTTVTFSIDTELLDGYTDEHIARLWHIAQANPASIDDRDAGRLAECIGREIIKRWLANAQPSLWSHQGHHADWSALCDLRQAQPALPELLKLGRRVAALNRDAGEIGPGMLASLVDDAKRAMDLAHTLTREAP